MYEELTPHPPGQNVESNFTAEMLRKDLESELRSDSRDIKSYAWYHGKLPRDVAEQMVKNEGDFLIRESVSSIGEHVLTVKWGGSVLHFKINTFVLQQSAIYSKIQYAFERDSFDSIPALIMFHVGRNIPISEVSGAIIRHPVNRNLPLSYSDVKYASLRRQPKKNGSVTSGVSSQPVSNNLMFSNNNGSLQGKPQDNVMHQRYPSDPFTSTPTRLNSSTSPKPLDGNHEHYRHPSPQPFPLQLPDNSLHPPTSPARSNRPHSQIELALNSHEKVVGRAGSDPSLSPVKNKVFHHDVVGPLPTIKSSGARSEAASGIPPKPSRVPSIRRPLVRHESGKSIKSIISANQQSPTGKLPTKQFQRVTEANTTKSTEKSPTTPSHLVTMRSTSSRSVTTLLGTTKNHTKPTVTHSRKSIFNPLLYASTLLSEHNKPVEVEVMQEIKKILLGTDPFKLARHLTFIDCEVCKILDLGVEDVFLPKGLQLRRDTLERYQCFAFWVAVCIIHGGTTNKERVDILNVFIQIANELVHSLGNVFGFSSVMHGLTCPQLQGLNDLWSGLTQDYTNNAVTMEKKLLPLIKLLDEGHGQINMESVCVPHLLPVIRFLENPLPEIPHSPPRYNTDDRKQLSTSEVNMLGSVTSDDVDSSAWWENLPNDSFDSLMAHLSIARSVLSSSNLFCKNAKAKFQDFERKQKIYEMFTTEFQLRLLWGYKGAESPQKERYEKFDKVVTVMAKRISS